MQEFIERANAEIFFFVNNAMKHPINDLWLGYSTQLGNSHVLFPIAAAMLFFYDRRAFWKNLGYLFAAGVIGGVVVTLAKLFFDAPRPLAFYHNELEAGLVSINVMFEPLYAHSFPSGHSQTAFTVAHGLALLCVRLTGLVRAGFYVIAAIIALSRLYVGAHFPVDILAGAAVGMATAHLTFVGLRAIEAKWAARNDSLSKESSKASSNL